MTGINDDFFANERPPRLNQTAGKSKCGNRKD